MSTLPAKRSTPRRKKHPMQMDGAMQQGRVKDSKARPMNALEIRHNNRVAAMGCLVCGKRPVCIHHERGKPAGKRDHKRTLPLCPDHHQHGPQARHKIGYDKFCKLVGFDLMEKAKEFWAKSQEIENG